MNQENRVYFRGLDGLRAIGALSVVLGHIELTKSEFSIPNLLHLSFYKNTSGHLGVILFFVLSGFLITYLLMEEKKTFNTISLKRFYFRRILRIWPIYYLTLILLLFVFPNIIGLAYNAKPEFSSLFHHYPTLLIFFLMAPNLMCFGIEGLGGGFHLSSIGTEEQFYIFWPWLIKWFKNLLIPLLFIFFLFALAPNFLDYINNNFFEKKSATFHFIQQLRLFTEYFKIDCMALGGIFSYFFFKKKTKILNLLFHRNTQIIALILGLGFWLFGISIPIFRDEFYALFFGITILNTAVNPKKVISFDHKWLNHIGKISYGIYVYHWIIILFVLNFTIQYKENTFVFNSILYICSIGLTILIAHYSFFKFELYFLKFKERFAPVKSNAKVNT